MVKCAECEYWEPLKDNPGMGLCRRNAPVPERTGGNALITAEAFRAVWLHTREIDSCGQGERTIKKAQKVDESEQNITPSAGGLGNPFNKAVAKAREGIKRG